MSLVYALVCRPTGKQYVGSTATFRKRRREHVWKLNRGTHHCAHLQNAWNVYGQRAFVWKVLAYCEPTDLEQEEQKCMDDVSPGMLLNSCPVAGSVRGFKHSLATREAMRQAAISHGAKPEVKLQRSQYASNRVGSMTGKKMSEAAKQKMREAAIRVASDPDERKRRSERAKAQHAAGKLGRQTWKD